MPRCVNPLAIIAASLCLLGTMLPAQPMAQSFGTRQPNISDWRLFHRNNDAYWARWLTSTRGWDPVDRTMITVPPSDVRAVRLLAGVADDEPADAIVDIEAKGMESGH